MSRIVTFNPEAREKLIKGVNTLADAVAITLGPRGRNVVIDTYGVPSVTKDGVTVAKFIQLEDPIENLGAQIINQSASRTASKVGDGTTTATVIAQALVNNADLLIKEGASPIVIKRGFEALLEATLAGILLKSTQVDTNKVKDIAVISSNGDEVIGNLIASAFEQVGKEGVLTVEDSRTNSTYVKLVDGYSFNRGFTSPYFVTDVRKMETTYEDPLIFVTDRKLKQTAEVVPIMEIALKHKRPLVIIADEIEAQPLSLLVMNRVRNNFPVVALNAPAYGERRADLLKDIAVVTGATLISDTAGLIPEATTFEQLGSTKKVIVTQSETVLVEPLGSPEVIQTRADEIKAFLEKVDLTEYEIEKYTERLAKLIAKAAVLYVGAPTETEIKEKKDRIDDAIKATRAALQSGYVPGGGTVFYELSQALSLDTEYPILDAFKSALQAPIRKIIENAGQAPEEILPLLTSSKGYNAATLKIEDLVKAGVIDPTSVLTESLISAVSAANMVILSEVTIHDSVPKYQPADPSQYG